MDNITHSLVGALIGQAGLKRKTGLAMPALIIGANLPDIDAACFFWLDGVEHLGFRRGITHGPIAWVLLPLILAGALWWFDRWQASRGRRPEGRLPVHFGWLYALSFIAGLSHPALDWLNVYGIRLLEPFSSRWFYGDTLFIIDVWLWALMGFATWFSLRRERQGGEWRRPAQVAIMLTLIYIGGNGAWSIHTTAQWNRNLPNIEYAELPPVGYPKTIASPVAFFPWQREILWGGPYVWTRVPGGSSLTLESAENEPTDLCSWPVLAELRTGGSQAGAFVFWSRAPFAERASDGSVILRDARFYDPRARDRFSVALPDVQCSPLAPR